MSSHRRWQRPCLGLPDAKASLTEGEGGEEKPIQLESICQYLPILKYAFTQKC